MKKLITITIAIILTMSQQGYALRPMASVLLIMQRGAIVSRPAQDIDSSPNLRTGRERWVQAQYEDILANNLPIIDIHELNERLSDVTKKFEWLVAKFMNTRSVEEYQVRYLAGIMSRSGRALSDVLYYENPNTPWKLRISNDGPSSPVCYVFYLDEELSHSQKARSEFIFHIHKGQLIYFSPGINITHEEGPCSSPYVVPGSYRIIPYPSEEVDSFKLFLQGSIRWNLREQYDCLKEMEEPGDTGSGRNREKLDLLRRKLDRLKIHLRERIVLEQISPPDKTLAIMNVLVFSYKELGLSSPLELIDLLELCCSALEDIIFGALVQNAQSLSFFKDQILALQYPRETLINHPDWLRWNEVIAEGRTPMLEKGISSAISQSA